MRKMERGREVKLRSKWPLRQKGLGAEGERGGGWCKLSVRRGQLACARPLLHTLLALLYYTTAAYTLPYSTYCTTDSPMPANTRARPFSLQYCPPLHVIVAAFVTDTFHTSRRCYCRERHVHSVSHFKSTFRLSRLSRLRMTCALLQGMRIMLALAQYCVTWP